MYTGRMDCFYIENFYDGSLQFYRFDDTNITYVGDIVSDLFPANFPTSKDANAEKHIQLASKCEIVKVLNKTYSLIDGDTPTFE